MRADHFRVVRMALGEKLVKKLLFDQSVRSIFHGLAAFITHHVALVSQSLLIDLAQQVPHAITFQPESEFQLVRGQSFEVIGAVEVGRAVDVAGSGSLEITIVLRRCDVLRAFKHHVLEQVSKPGSSRAFVGRADVAPQVDGNQGKAMIFGENHLQAILQGEFLVLDLRCGHVGAAGCHTQRENDASQHGGPDM